MLSYCVLSTEGTDTCSPSKEASGGWTWMDGRRVREEVLWEGPDRGVRVLAGVFVAPGHFLLEIAETSFSLYLVL